MMHQYYVLSTLHVIPLLTPGALAPYIITHLNYGNNENVNWHYQPVSGNLQYNVQFLSSDIEQGWDNLYYGPSPVTKDTRQQTCTGTCFDSTILSSTGIDFNFVSDSSHTKQGFQVQITYSTPPPPPGNVHVLIMSTHLV
jgi:hypothetical protein